MLFKKKGKPQFYGISTSEIPAKVKENTVYVVGEKSFKWVAIFKCPCGCGEMIQLNLLEGALATWRVVIHRNNTVTIKPSVWRVIGCKSHFTVRRGYINWILDYFESSA